MTSKAERRRRITGRRESGSFLAIPHAVLDAEAFRALHAPAVKLLLDLGSQYKGANNGDLCVAWQVMEQRGWRSRDTLTKAKRELLDHGLIELTRQGGLGRCSLYALTWRAIDECKGKLDVPATSVASGCWKLWKPEPGKQTASPPAVSARHARRASGQRKAA